LLKKHINKVLVRTIRNASSFDIAFYKHLSKNENTLFHKISLFDRMLLYFKSLFGR